jgi:hypothetical protein
MRRYSPASSTISVDAAITLGPFAMWTAFPPPDYYGPSAPSRRHQPATGLPNRNPGRAAGRDHQDGSHVHSRTLQRGRRPAMPLWLRCRYAAGFYDSLRAGDINQLQSSPTTSLGARHNPALICQVRAGGFRLRGVPPLVHFRYTFPFCLPDPHHLTVLVCPVVVRAAFRPPRCPPDQAALSFTRPAATSRKRCPFTTARFKNAS